MNSPTGTPGPVLAVCTGDAGDVGALRTAKRLADAMRVRLIVMSVVESDPGDDILRAIAGPEPDAIHEARRSERQEAVAGAMQDAGLAAEDADVLVTQGKAFQEVIRRADHEGCAMVVKPASHAGMLRRIVLGSEDLHLIRKSPVPVWILREATAAGGGKEILAAVDFDQESEGEGTEAALNTRILETVLRLADSFEADVRLVHVWQAPAEGLLQRAAPGVTHAQLEEYVRRVSARHRAALDTLCSEAQSMARAMGFTHMPHITPQLERGDARDVLPELANGRKPLALVMGTVARTGVPGLFVGNTAEDVLTALKGSVVAVKPPGFKTPVKL